MWPGHWVAQGRSQVTGCKPEDLGDPRGEYRRRGCGDPRGKHGDRGDHGGTQGERVRWPGGGGGSAACDSGRDGIHRRGRSVVMGQDEHHER